MTTKELSEKIAKAVEPQAYAYYHTAGQYKDRQLQRWVESAAPVVQRVLDAEQEDDGWVTFGRIRVNPQTETEIFERIAPAEAQGEQPVMREED